MIAVIDNDLDIVEDLEVVLSKEGFEVMTALSGQQGIEEILKLMALTLG